MQIARNGPIGGTINGNKQLMGVGGIKKAHDAMDVGNAVGERENVEPTTIPPNPHTHTANEWNLVVINGWLVINVHHPSSDALLMGVVYLPTLNSSNSGSNQKGQRHHYWFPVGYGLFPFVSAPHSSVTTKVIQVLNGYLLSGVCYRM